MNPCFPDAQDLLRCQLTRQAFPKAQGVSSLPLSISGHLILTHKVHINRFEFWKKTQREDYKKMGHVCDSPLKQTFTPFWNSLALLAVPHQLGWYWGRRLHTADASNPRTSLSFVYLDETQGARTNKSLTVWLFCYVFFFFFLQCHPCTSSKNGRHIVTDVISSLIFLKRRLLLLLSPPYFSH